MKVFEKNNTLNIQFNDSTKVDFQTGKENSIPYVKVGTNKIDGNPDAKELTSFAVKVGEQFVSLTKTEGENKFSGEISATSLENLVIKFSVSNGCSLLKKGSKTALVSEESTITFTNPVTFVVQAADKTKNEYQVTVTLAPSNEVEEEVEENTEETEN